MTQTIDMNVTKLDENTTIYAYGPMVLEGVDSEGEPGYRPIYSVGLTKLGKDSYVELGGIEGAGLYRVESEKDLTVDAKAPKITFKSQGTIYTVRRFQDSDGTWASTTGASAPAQILEEIFMNENAAEFAPGTEKDYAPEELYVLSDNEGDIAFLVYSGANQTFIRGAGAWEPLDDPDGDMLDDLYIDYVTPEFVDYFDKNEKKGLSLADVSKATEDSSVTASASTGFKFASNATKKD